MVCNRCKGKGRLLYTRTYHGERDETFEDDCKYCKGTGKASEWVQVPREALREVVEACVNPYDGGVFEPGELPSLDILRTILAS